MAKPNPLAEIRNLSHIECGEEAAKHFAFADGYTNLNHGSYGTFPIEVRNVFRHFQDRTEARPDAFVRYEYRTHLLNESRKVIADYLDIPVSTCVLVQNSTTAFDTIMRNLIFKPGDVILCFDTVYGSFFNTCQWLSETTPLEIKKVICEQPMPDSQLCDRFEQAIKDLRAEGKNPRIALFDTVNSLPSMRVPFEQLTELCRAHNVLSCVDGAHSVGQFPLDIQKLDPDFFMSNCHKWLFVPRPCCVFYVPIRNQHLLRATLPTGFDFVPLSKTPKERLTDGKAFAANFASVGTLDDNPYLCIEAALKWREKLTWNGKIGEEAVMNYMLDLAQEGGRSVASILGTEMLDNDDSVLSNTSRVNIRLPVSATLDEDMAKTDIAHPDEITKYIMKTMCLQHDIALCVTFYGGAWWVVLSAQVYLTLKDFERTGHILKEMCDDINSGKWRSSE